MNGGELFVKRLLREVPELEEVHDRHLDANGSLLPHVFMGDVTRYVIRGVGQSRSHMALKKLLLFFENELNAGDSESVELIRASFLENLMGEDATIEELTPLMGARLRDELKAISGD